MGGADELQALGGRVETAMTAMTVVCMYLCTYSCTRTARVELSMKCIASGEDARYMKYMKYMK